MPLSSFLTGTTTEIIGALSDARRFGVNEFARTDLPLLFAAVNSRGW